MSGKEKEWLHIGTALKVDHGVLDTLTTNEKSSSAKLSEVLQQWMSKADTSITWEAVISALEGSGAKIHEYLGKYIKL